MPLMGLHDDSVWPPTDETKENKKKRYLSRHCSNCGGVCDYVCEETRKEHGYPTKLSLEK